MDEALASQKPLPCNYHGITKGIKKIVASKKDAKEKIKAAKKEAAIATKAAATAKKAVAHKAAATKSAVTKVVGDGKGGRGKLTKAEKYERKKRKCTAYKLAYNKNYLEKQSKSKAKQAGRVAYAKTP